MTEFSNIICVSKRDNNKNRSFLFLNKFQGKYVPSDPDRIIEIFSRMAEEIPKDDKPTVVIGFAETATAIGAIVSENISGNPFYIHSTREELVNLPKLYFCEEHSHAKDHELSLLNKETLDGAMRFIFVDDEFTTGKTVCNFISAMQKEGIIKEDSEIIVTAFINCMKDTENFDNIGADYKYVISEYRDWASYKFEGEKIEDTEIEIVEQHEEYNLFHCPKSYVNPRHGASINEYSKAIHNLSEFVLENCNLEENYEKVLILGTEECMYPAIKVAKHLKEKTGKNVLSYATSRSPIVPMDSDDYVLKSRAKLKSFYDENRIVHLYNMEKYDKIIVVTDAKNPTERAINELVSLLSMYGNKNIDIIKWHEA